MSELAGSIREAALLEGDFLLRSGRRSNYYLDKYRFSTRPDLLGALGAAIAAAVREHEPAAVRLAAPELGAVPLAAAASLAAGLPFVIVRNAPKDHGTGNRIEGPFEPRSRPWRRYARQGFKFRRLCVSSTARRAGPMRSPEPPSGCAR
jgi:orotate phosphoribosyltransferase